MGHGVIDLLLRLVQLVRGETGHAVVPPAVPQHQGAHIGELFPPVEGEDGGVLFRVQRLGDGGFGVFGPLSGEQGEQHLLRRIAVAPGVPGHIIRGQPDFHISAPWPPEGSSWTSAPAPGWTAPRGRGAPGNPPPAPPAA